MRDEECLSGIRQAAIFECLVLSQYDYTLRIGDKGISRFCPMGEIRYIAFGHYSAYEATLVVFDRIRIK